MNERALLDRLRRANPVPDPDRIELEPIDVPPISRREDPMLTDRRAEAPFEPPPRGLLRPALATFAAVVAAGLAFWALSLPAGTGPVTDGQEWAADPASLDQPLRVLLEYQQAWNAGDLEGVMALFSEDPYIVGFGKSLAAARKMYALQMAFGSRIAYRDCASDGAKVLCTFAKEDSLLQALGLRSEGPATFEIEDGRIALLFHDDRNFGEINRTITRYDRWLNQEHGEALQAACPEGTWAPTPACVELVVARAAEWRATQE